MSKYEENINITVPRNIINRNFDEKTIVILLKLFSYGHQYIEVIDVLSDYQINRDDLKILANLDLISIEEYNNKLCINLEKYFDPTDDESLVLLSSDFIDRIHFLISRKLTPLEANQLQKWIDEGFEETKIEIALQKMVLNNVDNFNYAEKILYTDNPLVKKQTNVNEVKRNIDLY